MTKRTLSSCDVIVDIVWTCLYTIISSHLSSLLTLHIFIVSLFPLLSSLSLSLVTLCPSPSLIIEIYWKVRPRCIVRVQELLPIMALFIPSLLFLSLSSSISFAFSFVLSHSISFFCIFTLRFFFLSLFPNSVVHERVCMSRHRHSPCIDGFERMRLIEIGESWCSFRERSIVAKLTTAVTTNRCHTWHQCVEAAV